MTQDEVINLLLKVAVIFAFVSLVGWVAIYTRLTRWGVWKNPIGRTLVVKTLLVAAMLIPFTLSLFFHLTRVDSRAVGWVDVALIGAIGPVMVWRSVVWVREARRSPGTAPSAAGEDVMAAAPSDPGEAGSGAG